MWACRTDGLVSQPCGFPCHRTKSPRPALSTGTFSSDLYGLSHRLLGGVFTEGAAELSSTHRLFPPTPAGPSAPGRPLQGPFQPFCWLLRARPLHSGPVLLGPDHHAQGPGSSLHPPLHACGAHDRCPKWLQRWCRKLPFQENVPLLEFSLGIFQRYRTPVFLAW